uniref:P19 n=1 Tax=peony leafroll-associated virus TaxID=2974943 RepID=A0A977TJ50_9CLOS|nr:p19 [peony leafroll-associated virus]
MENLPCILTVEYASGELRYTSADTEELMSLSNYEPFTKGLTEVELSNSYETLAISNYTGIAYVRTIGGKESRILGLPRKWTINIEKMILESLAKERVSHLEITGIGTGLKSGVEVLVIVGRKTVNGLGIAFEHCFECSRDRLEKLKQHIASERSLLSGLPDGWNVMDLLLGQRYG